MRNAIIILVHQLPEQVNIFLNQLLKATNMDIYIHINKRYDSIREQLLKDERIIIPSDNVEITWGSDEILKAILLMFRHIEESGNEYGHVLINTGQDLLVKKGLDDYLEANKKQIFFEGYQQDARRRAFLLYNWPSQYRQLMDSKWNPNKILRRLRIELFTRGWPFGKKKLSVDTKKIVFYRNWFWGAIPYEVMNYILDYTEKNTEYMGIYSNALVPEEGFFLTLIMRSQYNDWVHFVNGRSNSLTSVLSRSNGHPTVVKYEDIQEIDHSEFYFARKFDIRIDKKVIQYYNDKILNN